MLVNYEDAKFHVRLKHSSELHLLKQFIKRKIGKFIRKPYQKDEYLAFAQAVLEKKKNSVIVDVGCNIGTTVIPLAKKFPDATFYALEPHPLPASCFIQNCELNSIKNVQLISCAVGTENAMANIYTCPSNGGGHRLTGFDGREDLRGIKAFGPISVPMKPLRQLFLDLEITHCDILKVDTEGFETWVLKSLGELLNPETIRHVIAEIGSEGLANANSSPAELFSTVIERGYSCELLQDKQSINSETDLPYLPEFVVKDLLFS